VSTAVLEQTLRDLPRLGTLVKDRPYRQVWRFEVNGKGYYLKFYPRPGSRLKRTFRGNPAMREFVRLQWLQKAKVPAPRAVAVLSGYVIKGVKGDAVISEAIEPAVQLDRYLNDFELRGERAPDHLVLARKVGELVKALGDASYGHDDLHLGNFLRNQAGEVYLLDAYAVTAGGLKMNQLLRLGHSVARYATRQDLRRGWRLLAPDSEMPRTNVVSPKIWRKSAGRIRGDNRYFGKLRFDDGWSGVFVRHWKYPHRFSPASRLVVGEAEWRREWPVLWQKVEGGLLEVLKSSRSGDVMAGEVTVAGRPVEVIVKRARRKRWYRYVNEIGRGSRSWRAWRKSWNLLIRNIPTAWPLLVMERRVMGYVVDQAIVFERVPGRTLATTNLDLLNAGERDALLRRCGRILRRIENVGFCHFDAKASNWIVMPDEVRGATPVLVDVDGVRFYRWDTFGIQRLLRSLREEHRQYTPADSLALCQGYAPFTRIEREAEALSLSERQEVAAE
jgi:tRNA A-37 threonylcarbamoyl transferase component Bud32